MIFCKNIVSLLLVLVLTLCFFVGCVSSVSNNEISSQSEVTSDQTESSGSSKSPSNDSSKSSSVQSVVSNTSMPIVISDEQRKLYRPTSLTISFYDISSQKYGFTYNTDEMPVQPVIQVCEGKVFSEKNCKEYVVNATKSTTYNTTETEFFVCKSEITLKPDTQYTYRAYDKGAKIGTEPTTLKTGNPKRSSFSFSHISDTQVATKDTDPVHSAIGTGKELEQILSAINKTNPNAAFLLHTGDIVQYSYESYWDNMIDYNFKSLSTIPIVPTAGNHDTPDYKGYDVISKRFNIKAPNKDTTRGCYYYFDYGEVRFIVLNTNETDSSYKLLKSQYDWLKSVLESNNNKWTIVSMHNPMYSVGKWVQNDEQNEKSLSIRAQLYKLFAKYNVDLVLQGHDHTYSKTYPIDVYGKGDTAAEYEVIDSVKYTVNPNGVIYAVHGASGNQSRNKSGTPDEKIYEIFGKSNNNSWANITVDEDKITVNVMYLENGTPKVWDSYGIIKR